MLTQLHQDLADMAGNKPTSRAKGKGKAIQNAVPDVYQDMLAEALPAQLEIPERPLKRRKTGPKNASFAASSSKPTEPAAEDDDDHLQFEDVLDLNQSDALLPVNSQQTAYRDSDDESDESDEDWQAINFDITPDVTPEPSGDLELTLSKKPAPESKSNALPSRKRRVVGKDERIIRVQVHKMHMLCLLSYLDRRNEWCNDAEVQASLRPLIDKKALNFMRPSSELSQFAQANSLKRGVEQVSKMWKSKFKITERGMRRALWAEDENDLQNVSFVLLCQRQDLIDTV
jgi:xeroderma pigmentosum group C-complementing protein